MKKGRACIWSTNLCRAMHQGLIQNILNMQALFGPHLLIWICLIAFNILNAVGKVKDGACSWPLVGIQGQPPLYLVMACTWSHVWLVQEALPYPLLCDIGKPFGMTHSPSYRSRTSYLQNIGVPGYEGWLNPGDILLCHQPCAWAWSRGKL